MKYLLSRHRLLLFCVLSLLVVVPSDATTIRGTVTDPLGAVVANAQVQLFSGNQVIADAVTGPDGNIGLRLHNQGAFMCGLLPLPLLQPTAMPSTWAARKQRPNLFPFVLQTFLRK